MKRIYERIVVSDTPPTSDSLWIDTSGEYPVLKIGAGFDWRPILGSASNGSDVDVLHIDMLVPDESDGNVSFWYFQGDTSIFKNEDTIELTVDNFEYSPVSLTKVSEGFFGSNEIEIDTSAFTFAIAYDKEELLPAGYNIGISCVAGLPMQ